MDICIYCKNQITDKTKSVEHTFPASFGCPNSWVLDCVCGPCNNLFGTTIENWLAGDSVESILRLKIIGSRSGQVVKSRRVRITVPYEAHFGEFQGAIFERNVKTEQLVLMPQVGLKNEKGEYEYFLEREMDYSAIQDRIKMLSKQDIKILGSDESQDDLLTRVSTKLNQLFGIKFTRISDLYLHHVPQGGKISTPVTAAVDTDLQRAVAKIAFNYVAKTQGSEFVLHSCFDQAREFINGRNSQKIVNPITEPVLLNDSSGSDTRILVHVFYYEGKGGVLRAVVSLFNQGTAYEVILSTELDPAFDGVRSGHICDPLTKEIDSLIPLKSDPV